MIIVNDDGHAVNVNRAGEPGAAHGVSQCPPNPRLRKIVPRALRRHRDDAPRDQLKRPLEHFPIRMHRILRRRSSFGIRLV